MKDYLPSAGARWTEQLQKLVGTSILIATWYIFVVPLVDRYYLHTFEADSSSVVDFTNHFRAYIHSFRVAALPTLASYPPYFDGQFFVYALVSDFVWLLRETGVISNSLLPTDQSLVLFGIRNFHCLCHLATAVIIFRTSYHLTRNILASLAGGLFLLFSQQLLAINFLRIDHLVLSLYTLLLCLAVVNEGESRNSVLYAFFMTAALLVSTKITSFVLVVIPMALVLSNALRTKSHFHIFKRPLLAGIALLALLSVRYLSQAPLVYANLIDKYQEIKKWEAVLPKLSPFYYVWELNAPNGRLFLTLSTASVVFVLVFISLKRDKSLAAIFISVGAIIMGTLSVFAIKYPRGGYHLLPLVILCAVLCLHVPAQFAMRQASSQRLVRTGCGLVIASLIAIFIGESEPAYSDLRRQSALYSEIIQTTRVEPRKWLETYFPKGTRITIPRHSDWAMPPIFEDGYRVQSNFLDFPYLDRVALANFHPPSISEMREQSDLILLNDFHVQCYINFMRNFGLDELAQEWVYFYNQTLAQFPAYRFVGRGRAYEVKEVRIVVINPSRAGDQLPKATVAPPPFAR